MGVMNALAVFFRLKRRVPVYVGPRGPEALAHLQRIKPNGTVAKGMVFVTRRPRSVQAPFVVKGIDFGKDEEEFFAPSAIVERWDGKKWGAVQLRRIPLLKLMDRRGDRSYDLLLMPENWG
jgi:hypothetical protein